MFKITLLSLFTCITLSSSAMYNQPQPLQLWAQTIQEIRVKTIKYWITIPINNNSTVVDIKNTLQEGEGIPVECQSLYPLVTNWWTLGLTDRHDHRVESNQENIKEIINRTNSNRFAVYLSLHQQRQEKA